jgi:hypothetical protein
LHPELQQLLDYHQQGPSQFVASVSLPSADGSHEDFSEITCYLAQQGASISFGDSAATYRCTNNFSKLAGARKLDKALSCGGINGPAMFTHVGLDLTLPVGLRLIFYGPTCAADLISLGYLNHTGRCAFLQDVDQVLHCYVDGSLLFSSPKQANHLYPVDTLRLQPHPSVDALSLISDLDFAKANAHLPRLSTGFPAAKLASLIAPSNVINTSSYLHPSSTASPSARALLSSSLRNTAPPSITSPFFTSPPTESASSPFFPHLGRRKSVVLPAHPPSLLDENPPPGFSPRVTLESSPALHAHSDHAQVATPHHLNREESRRVALVEELMRFLHYPRAAAVAKAAQGGSFASASPLGVQDFVNHAKVFGVDSHFKAGHFNNQHMTPSSSTPAPSPGHTMCFDISRLTAKSVHGYTHEIRVVSEKEGYFSVIPAKSGSCKDLFIAMYDYIATTYNAKGHRVEVAHADAEGVLKSMQANFGSIGIVLTLSPPGQHAQRVERYTQTLHQRSRSTLDSLCYVLPPDFLLYLHIAVGAAMNLTPNDVSAPYTPYELLHGRRKTFHKKCPFLPFGTVCSVGMGLAKRARIAKDRNYPVQDVAKSEVGVCMGESSVFPDSYLFYIQSSGLIVPRRVIAVLSPDTIPFGWKAQPSMTRLLKQFPVHLGDMDPPIPSLPNHRIQPVDPSRDTLLAPSPFSGPLDNDTSSDPREQVESLHRMPVPPLLFRHPTPLPVPPVIDITPVPLVPSLSSVVPDPVLVVPPVSVSPPSPVSPVVVVSPPTPPPDPPRRSSRATKGVSSRYAKDFLLSASVVTDVHPCAVLPPVHGLSRAVPSTVAPRASPPRVRSTVFRTCAASRPPLPPWPMGLAPASPSRFPLDHVPGHVTSHPCRALLSDLSTHEPLRSPSPLCSQPESSPSLGAEPASPDVPVGLRAPLREQHEVSYASALKNPALFPPALLDASVAKECDKMVPKLAVMDLVTDYKRQVAPDAIYIPCMLLCKPKYHSSGEFDCISSRLALNGAMQKEGTFGDTYAATADEASTLCCMSAFQAHAIQHNYTSQLQYASFDVCGAFLHCPLVSPRMIITKFPPNINHPYAGQLAIVRKSCYGLRQSNKTFADSLHKTILSAGFSVTLDPKIYMRVEDSPTVGEQQRRCYVSTHVDDGEAMFNYRPFYEHLIAVLERRYGELKKAPLTGFTGTTFQVHENGAFSRSQTGYIARFLASINVPGLAVSKVPSNLDLFADTSHTPKCDIKLYRSILGSLIHMLRTRYDIQKEVVHLSSKMSCPTQGDLAKAVIVLRYLSGTPALGPTYHTTKGPVLACYVDCSYGCHVDGRSHGGFTLHIGEDNAPFFVSSRKQKDCVAVGSMEGEYVELSAASRKVLEFRYFLDNIGFPQPEPTVIYEDNQSAINLAIAPAVTRKSRHIHIRHHFIRDLVEKKLVTIVHLPTERMLADFLTKPYGPKRFVMFRDRMFNVTSLP